MAASTTAQGGRRDLALLAMAGVTAIAIMLWLALGQTTAAFTDTTENPGNLFETGHVDISTPGEGVAEVLAIEDMLPGHSDTATIAVTNNSSAPLLVKFYTDTYTVTPAASGLGDNLDVLIEIETGTGRATVFEGTLADLSSAEDWDTGESATAGGDPFSSAPEDGSIRVYHFRVTLNEAAGIPSRNVNPLDEATITFIWEGRA